MQINSFEPEGCLGGKRPEGPGDLEFFSVAEKFLELVGFQLWKLNTSKVSFNKKLVTLIEAQKPAQNDPTYIWGFKLPLPIRPSGPAPPPGDL